MWKVIVALVVALALFGAGYYLGHGQIEIITREIKGETVTQTVTKVVTVERIVHPDGTVQQRTITRDEDRNQESKTNTKQQVTTNSKSYIPNYSIGIRYWANYSNLLADSTSLETSRLELSIGRRLLGNLWLEAGARTNSASLGLRVEF